MTIRAVLPRDAIPSIDDPEFGHEYFGDADDEVVVLSGHGGPARAYPLRILGGHEIVNDTVDGRPVAVTFCPICWSTVVYDRRVGGRTLELGVSGKLADDALVMYDRETGSEWKQPTGECIAGQFEGERLTALEAPVTTLEAFTGAHPDGELLQPVRGGPDANEAVLRQAYDMTGYERYRRGEQFGLYGMRGEGEARSWDREDLDPKAVVVGVESGADARAYPVSDVEAAGGVVRDTLGGRPILVYALDGAVGAIESPGPEFPPDGESVLTYGGNWPSTHGESQRGVEAPPVRSLRLFAFAWQDAHGPDAFWKP